MADTNDRSEHALEVAKKQGKLWYQIKRSKASYIMLAPYFILFFFFTERRLPFQAHILQ